MNLFCWDAFQCEAVDPVDVTAIATTVQRALATYGTPAAKEMIQNCMAQDLSWKVSKAVGLWDFVPPVKFHAFYVENFHCIRRYKKVHSSN